ncbi:uncharacterized protein KY384_004137 [Bacidia gigantensis]|uniref:uncharacterized protein n=1 Tax=Bacidia gigantensis TaxID=2732470 RepID=UPI001D03843B|nr:uncharacterized protein KY384_004137 [Bacidia gigantensis]KAG8530780.1 hypothetical protein KY384_004137 [Bacidia gigantensis]
MAALSSETTNAMVQAMDEVTSDPNKIPGCVFVAVDKAGKTLFQHASGVRGTDTAEPMTLDTVFWIASCTKMIGGIAAMQLVEKGILRLDDADLVERIAPELVHIKILKGFDDTGRPQLVDKKNRITMRMLLSHTAGFEYTFFNEKVRLFGKPVGIDEVNADAHGILSQPLLYEPGTDWSYGVGIDWVGIIIERLTKIPLNTYFQTHIFAPLGLHHITMLPTPQMISQLAHMHQKSPGQPLRARDHPYRLPLTAPPQEQHRLFNSAGAGCFARPTDYAVIISALLNNGTLATTGQSILSKASIDEMFKNQVPNFPNLGRKGIKTAKPPFTNDIPDFYPQIAEGGESKPQGWGLTFMLLLESHPPTGRSAGTAWWAGLPNLFWWADRETGVGGLIATQILPFCDLDVIMLRDKLEKLVYDGLSSEGKDDGYQQKIMATRA